ncbi:hypothetical protein LLH00_10430 [bacterium]|nr:hypothetical protein [bacterium]
MPDRFQSLEDKIKRLLKVVDQLEAENRSFRSLVGGSQQMSRQDIVSQVESLKLEKEKLERKLSLVDETLSRVLGELDHLEL